MMPANSTIYRWNEIASALGHTGTQVAVQQPANSFFLTDVEKVVEKVLSRNLKSANRETLNCWRSRSIRQQRQKGEKATAMPWPFLLAEVSAFTRLRPARSKRSARGCRGR